MATKLRNVLFSVAVAAVVAMPAFAQAQEEEEGAAKPSRQELPIADPAGEVISVERVLEPDARSALDDSAFTTRVRVDERRGETTSVAEVLAEGAGVQIRSLGGLGGFASVSVRGASSGATTVLVDGVPLSRLASVTADLGRFELGTFQTVDVYRGGAPASLGVAAMAGAINLHTRLADPAAPPAFVATLGAGSFGARHAAARYYGTALGRGLTLLASYRGADGDYPFLSDNGTNLNPDDDSVERRHNNGFDQLDVVARAGQADGGQAGVRFAYRDQGIPGFGSIQTESASLSTVSALADAGSHWRLGRGWATSARGYGYLERARYRDVLDEVGLGAQDRRYLIYVAGATAAAARQFGRHVASAGLELRLDLFDERDVGEAEPADNRGYRPALGITLADDIALARGELRLSPAVRLDVVHTRPAVDSNAALGADAEDRSDIFPSPRVSARLRVSPSVSLKGNAGLYFRAPTLPELFGDRGFVVGNPDLDPERGLAGDVGVVFASAGRGPHLDRLFAELAVFATRARDVIAFVSNAGGFTGALNLGTATTAGAELTASARVLSHLTASGNYTLLWTRRDSDMPLEDGTELPRRPRHQLYGRADVDGRLLGRVASVWTDAALTTQSYSDAANRDPMPARLFVGAGVKVQLVGGVHLGAEVKNVFDHRVEDVELSPPPSPELSQIPRAVADFFGYPLPGRAFYASLEMTI